MKAIVLISLILFTSGIGKAQTPVSWNYSAKRISNRTYEIRLTATIQNGWHLYSQKQPENAIALPTEISFNKNPLLEYKDKVKENGKLEKYSDKTLGIEAWQYSGKVEFVQTVKVKANIKTNISGKISYQVCTDEKCLPLKTVPFTVAIQ